MIDAKRQDIILRKTINDDCYQLIVANDGPGFNHFELYVDHINKVFHIFDPITLECLDYARGTAADQHIACHNLKQRICSSLELDYSTYNKALIYIPSSNDSGIEFQPHGVGNPVPETIKYEPFVKKTKIISKGMK
ncbi:hypothetical protein [Bacillus sp. FSL R9-9410]|uniref:hypothetical protein n=1 Tax=Bacillus sp. FSL R9-9410 TaxID=2921590 RepID=UPI003101AC62